MRSSDSSGARAPTTRTTGSWATPSAPTPSPWARRRMFYRDSRDAANAFAAFRTSNARSTANGKRIVVAGANDGQLHAFRTSDGAELWSFIAPNLLSKLKHIAHNSHPTGLTHQYYVDGPISVADVWLGSGDGTTKSPSDWKTLHGLRPGQGRDADPLELLELLRQRLQQRLLGHIQQLLRLLCPGYHEHGRPRLQMAHRPVGQPGPLPRRPLEQDDGEPGEDRRRGEVGRVHRRRAQLVELHGDGLRQPRERVSSSSSWPPAMSCGATPRPTTPT